jgi:hypothetical protein
MADQTRSTTPTPDDYRFRPGGGGHLASVRELDEQLTALEIRDLLSRHPEIPAESPDLSREPLGVREHLEVLALSEAIARRARHFRGVQIDAARRAGARWSQIAGAVGTTEADVRDIYDRWIAGQRQLFVSDVAEGRPHRFGMGDDEYAAALKRLAADEPREGSDG